MKKIVLIMLLLVLMACKNNEKTLDTQNLENTENNTNENVTYTAKTLEEAIESLPYPFVLPNDLPKIFNSFELIAITDWDEIDGRDISIGVRAISKEGDYPVLSIGASDDNDSPKLRGERVRLKNNQIAYLKSPKALKYDFTSVSISWESMGVKYSIVYTGENKNSGELKEMMLNLAYQMQGNMEGTS